MSTQIVARLGAGINAQLSLQANQVSETIAQAHKNNIQPVLDAYDRQAQQIQQLVAGEPGRILAKQMRISIKRRERSPVVVSMVLGCLNCRGELDGRDNEFCSNDCARQYLMY